MERILSWEQQPESSLRMELEKPLTCAYHICMRIHSLVPDIASLKSVTESLHDKSGILAHTYFRKTIGAKMDGSLDKRDTPVDKPV